MEIESINSDNIEKPTQKADHKNGNRLPIQLSWHDIVIDRKPIDGCCSKGVKEDLPVILDGVSGCVNPGGFLSIIGASGAGKTTLLNYLSGKLISMNLAKSGQVLINGQDRDKISGIETFSAYV